MSKLDFLICILKQSCLCSVMLHFGTLINLNLGPLFERQDKRQSRLVLAHLRIIGLFIYSLFSLFCMSDI